MLTKVLWTYWNTAIWVITSVQVMHKNWHCWDARFPPLFFFSPIYVSLHPSSSFIFSFQIKCNDSMWSRQNHLFLLPFHQSHMKSLKFLVCLEINLFWEALEKWESWAGTQEKFLEELCSMILSMVRKHCVLARKASKSVLICSRQN